MSLAEVVGKRESDGFITSALIEDCNILHGEMEQFDTHVEMAFFATDGVKQIGLRCTTGARFLAQFFSGIFFVYSRRFCDSSGVSHVQLASESLVFVDQLS